MQRFFRTFIREIVRTASETVLLRAQVTLPLQIKLQYPPNATYGDYSSPNAMELAKALKKNPRAIAEEIAQEIRKMQAEKPGHSGEFSIADVRIEGPGFINFFLADSSFADFLSKSFHVNDYLEKNFKGEHKPQEKINLEYVSANPTGPLNIVSSRAAALGDTISRILSECGYSVNREYYVNDYGNQVEILGRTFVYRYAQKLGISVQLPEDSYMGSYIIDVLEEILKSGKIPPELQMSPEEMSAIFSDEIRKAEYLSRTAGIFGKTGLEMILGGQKKDLENFGVFFDLFFSERTLHETGKVAVALELLRKAGHTYDEQGAVYFRSTDFGDEKDRVLMRSDGRPTYFLADIAYHIDKFHRGFTTLYDIWGPDHHGYIPRLTGALEASGIIKENNSFSVIIAQQVNLLENGKPVEMSKRAGKFQTMKDLLDIIPLDAARYFFLMRAISTPLDFDLDLAREKSSKNPVYYIQYAHARIYSIFREANIDVSHIGLAEEEIPSSLQYIIPGDRKKLLMNLSRLGELLEDISQNLEAHRLASFLLEVATDFTEFYHGKDNRVVEKLRDNPPEGKVLVILANITREILEKGLSLMGVRAPERM